MIISKQVGYRRKKIQTNKPLQFDNIDTMVMTIKVIIEQKTDKSIVNVPKGSIYFYCLEPVGMQQWWWLLLLLVTVCQQVNSSC